MDCLGTIGISVAGLSNCGSLGEEWTFIKKAYFKKILTCHPDKGGDPAVFRDVQASFEVLRRLFDDAAVKSFAAEQDQATADLYKGTKEDLQGMSTPSWEYYAEAAKEVTATYRVELARSNRSRCQKSGDFIEKGELRIGFILESGSYGLWVHIDSWRVPSKIWKGLPDPAKSRNSRKFEKALLRMNEVSLCGMRELAAAARKKVVRYVMDKSHWTYGGNAEKIRKRGTRSSAAEANEGSAASGGSASQNPDATQNAETGLSLVVAKKAKERFVIPVPGSGAPKAALKGQTFVVTGVFPEVGGGEGLSLGKDRVKKMITSFGGKVTGSVSRKTDVLVVGKDPGFSKVSLARKHSTSLLSVHDVKVGLEKKGSLEDIMEAAKPMLIDNFSKGYSQRRGGPNGMARKASKKELAIASGRAAPALANKAAKKRPAAAVGAGAKLRRLR